MNNNETKERIMRTLEVNDTYNTFDLDVTDLGPYGTRISIGRVLEGEEAREVAGGPMIAGPWAWCFNQAVIIDGTKRDELPTIKLNESFALPGMPGTWHLEPAPNGNAKVVAD